MSEIKCFTLDANIDGMDQVREFVLASDYDARVHDLETMCDPAGLTAENALLRDQTRMLDAMIGRLKSELQAAAPTQGADARPVAWECFNQTAESDEQVFVSKHREDAERFNGKPLVYATRDAAPSDAPKEDAKRLKQLEHALVYVAHSMHSEPQYMLAEGITLGDVSFVRVKIADIDVSVDLPESVARAMYDAAMQATATKDEERRIAIAAIAPREKT